MASLNTLRTKFGALLSVIIALALLAFILSLKTDMGFSDNDPKVGVIDGDKIRYSEYLNQYDAIKNRNGGVEASTDQESDQLAAATWQALFADHALVPGFERMGIEVPEQERLDMVSGKIPSQAFYSAFGDPRTGAYNAAAGVAVPVAGRFRRPRATGVERPERAGPAGTRRAEIRHADRQGRLCQQTRNRGRCRCGQPGLRREVRRQALFVGARFAGERLVGRDQVVLQRP